ncbi:CRISPR-associated endonuclease/helicase Cas3 [Allostreptomyces psammosilenae]|uniref:CRISPR-associated endonuclease/helicase Cas3 n=1 Tax=Allostreptomyces psammosilenae TaxID=1892865 RepID=A0A852ZM23_9ACTN|nr:CRISPR-associated endonuclease/helicase Cas3 [Allostreptomyces psammosilenae]
MEYFTRQLGFADLAEVAPVRVPSRAAQLHLSGLVVMADWIASDERYFPGVDVLGKVSLEGARERARLGWEKLGLRGGWGALAEPGPDAFRERFGNEPRPSQHMVVEAAMRMEAPGLLVVEAPMGEGKTKAALLAAEVLAARFGADGVFVGMPTQATSDPMFTQVRTWVKRIDEGLGSLVCLLHGKRMVNKEWRELLRGVGADGGGVFGGVDEYGEYYDDDPYGLTAAAYDPPGAGEAVRQGPAEWFLGAKRGLLCPFVVGTIDQLLFAATRTRHVMLRMAGLAGKVVVLDEVHAADVYMSQFLMEGLRWLGQAGVPVILLSATLAPGQRRALTSAYLAGAASREKYEPENLPEPGGYPAVTAAWWDPGQTESRFHVDHCASWRPDLTVRVELLPEQVPGRQGARDDYDSARQAAQALADAAVVDLLERELAEGGCALVIRNTVDRAQTLYERLRVRFGPEVELLHGRLAIGPRADRTDRCLELLGPPPRPGQGEHQRPGRMILVATQIAEQSFDVDADLLITDLAPIDLLLQRVGRLHRHDGVTRPGALRVPRVVITGFGTGEAGAPPRFLPGSEAIYGRFLLLRTAAQVLRAAAGEGWSIPGQVPDLVRAVYDVRCGVPDGWRGAEARAEEKWEREQTERAGRAAKYVLTRLGEGENTTLSGLHYTAAAADSDDSLEAAVRDGKPSMEVVLVLRGDGVYRTLSGRALTPSGDVAEDLLDDVLAGTIRLPSSYTEAVTKELLPLPGWYGHPWLRHKPALVLDADRRAVLGGQPLRYDDEQGLVRG